MCICLLNKYINKFLINCLNFVIFLTTFIKIHFRMQSKSINLISKKSDNTLVLNMAALKTIQNLKGEIAVCVCVGSYRSGKSFLLNLIASHFTNKNKFDDGCVIFQVDHGQDGFTKGCWMNEDIPLIKINDKWVNLIFIDTEVKKYLKYHQFELLKYNLSFLT